MPSEAHWVEPELFTAAITSAIERGELPLKSPQAPAPA